MNKEVFLAVSVGFILGLIITFGIWTANNSLKNHPLGKPAISAAKVSPSPSAQVSPTPPPQLAISFTSPDDESLFSSDSLTVTGKTVPNAVVALTYDTGENILTADTTGAFSADIKLDGGYNRITATAFDQNGHSGVAKLLVTYTTSKI